MNDHSRNYSYSVYYFAAIISVLLSCWIAYREMIINPDAICYLQSAALVGAGGLRKAMNLCAQAQWPLYSILIYFSSHILHVSLTTAAYMLDTLFSMVSVVTFIAITHQLGGSKRVLWIAAFVILLAHEFNSIRQYIIRDHGFITFYLLSIFLLLRYFSQLRWYDALAWGFTLLFATLFRIEGALFFIILPWTIWFLSSYTYWQRVKGFFLLNIILLTAGMAVFGWLIFHPEISLASLGRMQEFVFQLFHAFGLIWNRLHDSIYAFGHSALVKESMADATMVFILALIMWYVVKVAAHLSFIYSGLVIYGFFKKVLPQTKTSRLVLYGYIITNVWITSFFLAEHLFLSKRYLTALILVLMFWVPFSLDNLIGKWQTGKISHGIMSMILALIFITSLGGIIDFGYSKAYMRHAGDWLAENVPKTASLYSNDYQIMYYSHHFGNDIFQKVTEYEKPDALANGRWRGYDYVAIRFSKKEWSTENRYLNEIQQMPIRIFINKRGDQVRVYKMSNTSH